MGYNGEKNTSDSNTFLRWIGRMVIVAIILGVTSFLTPGFTIYGLWSYLIAAVVISALDYLVESFMNENISPFGKGISNFCCYYLCSTILRSIYGSINNWCNTSSSCYWHIRCYFPYKSFIIISSV